MKLVEKLTKTAEYFGIALEVEAHMRYIATDSNGKAWAYERRPELSGWYWYAMTGDVTAIARIDLDGMDWKETLVAL